MLLFHTLGDRGVHKKVAGRGLHSSASQLQLEPCLAQENPLHTLNTPSHPMNTGYTIPTRTPSLTKRSS
jgi:hypothetical protein